MARSIRALCIALLTVGLAAPPASPQTCSPSPTFEGSITSPQLAIPGWPLRRATTQEMLSYFRLVDGQTDRVRVGQFATSWRGTPLLYALVGTSQNVANADGIAAAQERLRDPRVTPPAEAERIASDSPAIAWYAGNVHGLEMSGADAALQILYELAARTDCEVVQMRDRLLTGVIATQNPDGRDSATRGNNYGFDMNRDWFARTQPEIDGELDLLDRYPPILFIDAHEQAVENFFFPPNDDPIHHEISEESIHWINDLYGAALQKEFDRRRASDPANWDYFNHNTYDLFFMGYGDSAPSAGFTAAGMTFEKGTVDPDHVRQREQFVAGWTSLLTASTHKVDILRQYYKAHQDAIAQGKAGMLEPNAVYAPGNELRTQVPDLKVRHYFLAAGRAQAEAYHLVERLMEMDVEVYKLRRKLKVPGLQAYGRDPARGKLPKGTFWIPMAQPQKHWIQALLGEDPYGSLVYFYDVSAWSNPLLMNVDAWFTGTKLKKLVRSARRGGPLVTPPKGGLITKKKPKRLWFLGDTARAVAAALQLSREAVGVRRLLEAKKRLPAGAFVIDRPVSRPLLDRVGREYQVVIRGGRRKPPAGAPVRSPKIAVYNPPDGGESLGHLRYTLDNVWNLSYTLVDAAQVGNGTLTSGGYDVFIVPGVSTSQLDPAAIGNQIRSWIQAGGIYIGTARTDLLPNPDGGTPYAIEKGFTSSSQTEPPGYMVPGTLFRASVRAGTPLTAGSSPFAYWWNLDDLKLNPSTTGLNAVSYPGSEPDFWFSGYAEGQDALKGSAGLVEEKLGSGRVILFSGEPNYRAYTEGPAFFLANAIAYPDPIPAAAPMRDVRAPSARDEVNAARLATAPIQPGRPFQIVVPSGQVATTRGVLATFTDRYAIEEVGARAYVEIPNRLQRDIDQHPFARLLVPALRRAGVRVLAAAF